MKGKKREPKKTPYREHETVYPDLSDVASATECTGLMPTPPQNDAELESYQQLYGMEYPRKLPGKYDEGAYTLREKADDLPGWPDHGGAGSASE